MKKLGLIDGMGPESTLLYYNDIVYNFQKEEPNGYFPALTIETVNMYEMLVFCKNKDYLGLTEYLMKAIDNVIAGGADFITLASNTPHVVFEKLEKRSNVPMLSIVEPAYEAIAKLGLKKIAWLGTAFTMEEEYFIESRFIFVTYSSYCNLKITSATFYNIRLTIVNKFLYNANYRYVTNKNIVKFLKEVIFCGF